MKRVFCVLFLLVMSCTTGEKNPTCISVIKGFFDNAPEDAMLMRPVVGPDGASLAYQSGDDLVGLCFFYAPGSGCADVGDSNRQCRVDSKVQLFYGSGKIKSESQNQELPKNNN